MWSSVIHGDRRERESFGQRSQPLGKAIMCRRWFRNGQRVNVILGFLRASVTINDDAVDMPVFTAGIATFYGSNQGSFLTTLHRPLGVMIWNLLIYFVRRMNCASHPKYEHIFFLSP